MYTIREECCNVYANVDIVSTEFSPLVTGLLTIARSRRGQCDAVSRMQSILRLVNIYRNTIMELVFIRDGVFVAPELSRSDINGFIEALCCI